MSDPRTEIRDRIVRRLNTDEWMTEHFGIACHAGDVADAVLELFGEVGEESFFATEGVIGPPGGPGSASHRSLVLRTVPEELPTEEGSQP